VDLPSTVTGGSVALSEDSVVVAENAVCARYILTLIEWQCSRTDCIIHNDMHDVFLSFVFCIMIPTEVMTGLTAICVTF
jgi:hypothetical protein